ncbi:MAG TPA: hypothetical protein VKF63_07870, partial [Terracidiphilus sp.]|nr:hypothetical protein [Terracidiphilus sp.]
APAGTIIKVTDIAQSPKTVMTPGQLSLNGVNTMADNLKTIDTTYDGYLYFVAGESSSMTFIVPLKKNTVTILDMKVFLVNDNAQMTASNLWYMNDTKVTSGETFNGSSGDNEFAYSFVSDKAGDNYFEVTFFSPNSDWFFKSCEITSTAF